MFGGLLETFVVSELRKQASWSSLRVNLYHFRTAAAREVDIVLEGPGNRIVGIEVKPSATVTRSDFAGLQTLAEAAGTKFVRGIVLYDGDTVLPFGDRMIAAPISALWSA